MKIPPAPYPGAQLRWVPKKKAAITASKPSAAQLRLVCEGLLAEAFSTEDAGKRSRLLDAAGRVDIRRQEVEEAEHRVIHAATGRAAQAHLDRWIAEASATLPGS